MIVSAVVDVQAFGHGVQCRTVGGGSDERKGCQRKQNSEKYIPVKMGEHQSRQRAYDSRTGVVEQPVEARCAAFGFRSVDRHDAAGYGVGGEKGESEYAQSADNAPQSKVEKHQQSCAHQQQKALQQFFRGMPVRQVSGYERARHAGGVHQKHHSNEMMGQMEGRRAENKGNIVVHAHEGAHDERSYQKHAQKRVLREQAVHLSAFRAETDRHRAEIRRAGYQPEEQHAEQQTGNADSHGGRLPAVPSGNKCTRHASRHASDGVAAQVEADGGTDDRLVDFFRQIGECHGTHSGKRRPFQEAEREQQRKTHGEGRCQCQQRRGDERHAHQSFAGNRVGGKGKEQQAGSHADGRQRHRKTACRHFHAEELAQFRQQRLEQVELCKYRQPGNKHTEPYPSVAFRCWGAILLFHIHRRLSFSKAKLQHRPETPVIRKTLNFDKIHRQKR